MLTIVSMLLDHLTLRWLGRSWLLLRKCSAQAAFVMGQPVMHIWARMVDVSWLFAHPSDCLPCGSKR